MRKSVTKELEKVPRSIEYEDSIVNEEKKKEVLEQFDSEHDRDDNDY